MLLWASAPSSFRSCFHVGHKFATVVFLSTVFSRFAIAVVVTPSTLRAQVELTFVRNDRWQSE